MNKNELLNSLWVEKYRPSSLEEMALQPAYRQDIEGFIKDGIIPHLMFEGPAGSGKTTIAKVLIDLLDCSVLSLNASDERGIDVIRNRIKTFAMMDSDRKFKLVFLDESDKLTPDAQDALKNLMEQFAAKTRFIMTCNTINKVIDPIQSRCQIYHFNSYPKDEMKKILLKILTEEKIGYEDADVDKHIEKYFPDLRKSIGFMQQNIRSGKFEYIDNTDLFTQIITLILSKKIKDMRVLLSQNSIDYVELYRFIFDNTSMFPNNRADVLIQCAEYMYRHTSVPDSEINFAAYACILTRLL